MEPLNDYYNVSNDENLEIKNLHLKLLKFLNMKEISSLIMKQNLMVNIEKMFHQKN